MAISGEEKVKLSNEEEIVRGLFDWFLFSDWFPTVLFGR